MGGKKGMEKLAARTKIRIINDNYEASLAIRDFGETPRSRDLSLGGVSINSPCELFPRNCSAGRHSFVDISTDRSPGDRPLIVE